MGLFGKSDELFELMAKKQEGCKVGDETRRQRRRMMTSTFSLRRPGNKTSGSGGFGPRKAAKNSDEPDFFEVDGDALIVVDDGWSLGDGDGEDAPTFAIRSDTLVVGAFLSLGLIAAAFLVGRTSADPDQAPQVSVSAEAPGEEAQASAINPANAAGALVPNAPLATAIGGGAVQPEANTVPNPAPQTAASTTRTPQATTMPASAPRQAKAGKYVLVVCTTRPGNATKLAKWLNTAPKSPIFGRNDVQAYATRKGVVRIRGFQKTESQVLAQVKATNDPLGGNGTFHTAYYKNDG